jgi:hypothetical protein
MGVLAHLGLFVETAPGQFTCTPLGALLQTDAPQSVRHFAMLMGGEWFGPTWPRLAHSVRTGTSAFESVFGMNVYSYLPQHPAALAVFQQTMSDLSADEGLAVRDAYDFARCHTVVDVGGGRGGLLAILLQAFPSLQGILFDLPVVVEGAQAVFQTEPLRGRCRLVGGNFLEAVPAGGDLYILKRVLVDRTDDEARTPLHQYPPRDGATRAGPRGRSGWPLIVREVVRHVDAHGLWQSSAHGSRSTGAVCPDGLQADPGD